MRSLELNFIASDWNVGGHKETLLHHELSVGAGCSEVVQSVLVSLVSSCSLPWHAPFICRVTWCHLQKKENIAFFPPKLVSFSLRYNKYHLVNIIFIGLGKNNFSLRWLIIPWAPSLEVSISYFSTCPCRLWKASCAVGIDNVLCFCWSRGLQ